MSVQVEKSERKLFEAAYHALIGDSTKLVDQKQLFEIIVAAGKDLRRSQLDKWIQPSQHGINFEDAFEIYNQIETVNLEDVVRSIDSEQTGYVQLEQLLSRLQQRTDIIDDDKDELKGYFTAMSKSGLISWRNLLEDIETVRMRLNEVTDRNYDAELIQRRESAIISEDMTRNELPPMGSDGKSTPTTGQTSPQSSTSQTGNPVLPFQHSSITHSDDQPPSKNFNNSIFIVLSDANTEQVMMVTNKLVDHKYYCEECTLGPGQYSVTFHSCRSVAVSADQLDKSSRVPLVDKETGKLTKSFRYDHQLSFIQDAHFIHGIFLITATVLDQVVLQYNLSSLTVSRLLDCLNIGGRMNMKICAQRVISEGISAHFRMTLMNIFDLFDFDENGTLSRSEFDAFNVVASDEHVSDQEWDVLLDNFETRNGELTMSSLIALHQVEADNNDDLEETWISLQCIGYNANLSLELNCPLVFTMLSEQELNLSPVELRLFSSQEEQMITDYFWANSSECSFSDGINIGLWKSEYFAVCVAGPMVLPVSNDLIFKKKQRLTQKAHKRKTSSMRHSR
ncbi:unnamed protein product [Anisakis simplex]|uniref:EF-hand domain-containing protein n=1 Tax=Anisakis simplex TaxID=6269 RepID=A0A0M3IYL7_ANISI|nr:unnamed protein product [Anisakis simplex]